MCLGERSEHRSSSSCNVLQLGVWEWVFPPVSDNGWKEGTCVPNFSVAVTINSRVYFWIML